MFSRILNIFAQAANLRADQLTAEGERRRARYWANTTPEQHSRNLADDVNGYTEADRY